MAKTIGLNLGSDNITVYLEKKGIILREPNVIAIDVIGNRPIASGQSAMNISNRTPGAVKLIRPIYEGRITDYDMIKQMFSDVFKRVSIPHPDVIISLSKGLNKAEIEAVVSALMSSGAKSVSTVDLLTVNTLGSGQKVSDNRAMILIDIGAGTSEIGLIKGCVTKYSHIVRYGCNKLDQAIKSYVRRKYNVDITDSTARAIREEVGSVHEYYDVGIMNFTGKDMMTGLPCSLAISSEETRGAMIKIIQFIIAHASAIIKSLPEDILSEVKERGVLITGGGALERGIKELIIDKLDLPVLICDNATECAIEGLGMIVENRKTFDVLLEHAV